MYAGTAHRVVQRLSKDDGRIEATYACDSAVYSCATSPGGRFVFAGDGASSVYCFDRDGTRLWKLGTGGGSALSMQYRDERLYLVTTDGSLVCVDAGEAAIEAAQRGTVPVARDVKLAAALPTYAPATAPASVAAVADAPAGSVVVECVQDGGRLRVHVVSEGYEPSWNVQFPRDTGARRTLRGGRAARGGGRLLPGPRGHQAAPVTGRGAVFEAATGDGPLSRTGRRTRRRPSGAPPRSGWRTRGCSRSGGSPPPRARTPAPRRRRGSASSR